GGLAEPEVPAVQLLEPRGAIQNRCHLAAVVPPLASDAERRIALELLGEIILLKGQRLLRPQQVRIERGDRLDQEVPPVLPPVLAISGGAIPQVETHHPHPTRLGSGQWRVEEDDDQQAGEEV